MKPEDDIMLRADRVKARLEGIDQEACRVILLLQLNIVSLQTRLEAAARFKVSAYALHQRLRDAGITNGASSTHPRNVLQTENAIAGVSMISAFFVIRCVVCAGGQA